MEIIIEEVTGPANEKRVMLLEALQQALDNAPPPPPGEEVQNFRLLSVEWEHGGFVQNRPSENDAVIDGKVELYWAIKQ